MKPVIISADYHNSAHQEHIAKLMNHYAKDIMGGGESLHYDVKNNLPAALANIPGAITLLCYEGTEAIGLLNALSGFSTFYAKPLLNIHDVVVLESFRGRGIARQMINTLEEIAIKRGCCKLTLEVLEGNTAAQKAYLGKGFEPYQLDEKAGKAQFWEKVLIQ